MKKKILIVDDDVTILSFVKLVLEDSNFDVDIAKDGVRGSKLAIENKYDIIILDIIMPEMNGFEVCKKIREQGINTPILIASSLFMEEDKDYSIKCGADDFLVKPFSFLDLQERIETLNMVSDLGKSNF